MFSTDKAFNRSTTESEGILTISGILFLNIKDFCSSECKWKQNPGPVLPARPAL